MDRGLFITFEGPEGAGKTTQINLLKDYLENRGIDIILSREPGGTDISKQIRKILLDGKNKKMTSRTELLLYAADRAQHVDELILPSIENGKYVLCDRYYDSTIAYQGYGRKLDLSLINNLVEIATNGLKPDITFLIDILPEKGMERVVKRTKNSEGTKKDRIESEKMDFHHRIRNGFLKIASEEPDRLKVIDGMKKIDDIHFEILNILKSRGFLDD